MKILRVKQLMTTDLDLEFEDDEADFMAAMLDRDFPEVEYEIIEKSG